MRHCASAFRQRADAIAIAIDHYEEPTYSLNESEAREWPIWKTSRWVN
jgi:hypothetical protein